MVTPLPPVSPALIRPQALLFDMDGTLTRPMLDFPRIKADMGIGDAPILEAMAQMDPLARRAAEQVLLRHEEEAAQKSVLNTGCRELLHRINEMRLRTALITRNSTISVQTVLRLHDLRFEVMLTRDDAKPKPHPHALHEACRRLGVQEAAVWMVGDGQYDVEAGQAAGVKAIWLSHGRPRPFAAKPWRTVRDLCELSELLDRSTD